MFTRWDDYRSLVDHTFAIGERPAYSLFVHSNTLKKDWHAGNECQRIQKRREDCEEARDEVDRKLHEI